eukprot:scaffold21468_cov41-Phaeocystis_antarctica.AAC.2
MQPPAHAPNPQPHATSMRPARNPTPPHPTPDPQQARPAVRRLAAAQPAGAQARALQAALYYLLLTTYYLLLTTYYLLLTTYYSHPKLALYRLRRRHAQLALQVSALPSLSPPLCCLAITPHISRCSSSSESPPGWASSQARSAPTRRDSTACSASHVTSSTPRTGSIARPASGSAPSSAAGASPSYHPCVT